MSNPENISTIAQLEQRKRALELEEEVSRRELAHSLGTSRMNLNDFLLKRVALPVGGAIAGIWITRKLLKKRDRHTHEIHEKTIVREVSADDHVAVNHYPVPPPEIDLDDESPRYVPQPPRYRRAAPAPAFVTPQAREEEEEEEEKQSLINLATIASVARVAIPAVKAIISAVDKHKQQQSAGGAPAGASDELPEVA